MKKRISIALCIVLLLSLALSGCSKEVTVNAENLNNISMAGAETAVVGEEYTVTLTPAANYELPEKIVVSVEDVTLTSGYTYDSTSGKLTISPEAVTGNITIGAEGVESILGNWEGAIDFGAILTHTMSQNGDVADYFNFENIDFVVTMAFQADGICKLVITEESVNAAMITIKEQMKSGVIRMLEEILKQNNVDMSVEDYLSANNIKIDDLLDDMFTPEMLDEMTEEFTKEGKYKKENGVLYISDDIDEEPNEDEATPYTLENGILTIEAPEGVDEEMAKFMFPLVLKRVN